VLSVVSRFRVQEGAFPGLVRAARVYQRQTRDEPGNLRCELCHVQGQQHEFVLWESFRDGHARTLHVLTPYARVWREALGALVSSAIQEEALESVIADVVPPPLPLGLRPAVESSSAFGSGLHETRLSVAPVANGRLPQLTLDVEAIEVAAARDHVPLRSPQPCVVIGAFVVDAAGAHGIGRTVYRFTPAKSLPAKLVGKQRLLDVPVLRGTSPFKVAVAAISVEENGGRDVQAIYQALADAQDLSFWTQSEHCPSPVSLPELQELDAFRDEARRVQVLRRTTTLSESLSDDTWAGAALGAFDLSPSRPEVLARFHTASEDRRNDWLLTLRCRLS
jgi:quinol monooxygenase YgiN